MQEFVKNMKRRGKKTVEEVKDRAQSEGKSAVKVPQ